MIKIFNVFSVLKKWNKRRKYNSYMQSKEWKLLRKRILIRDEHKCQICGTNKFLEVHHLYYEKSLYNTKEYQLITLCKKHHKQLHKIRK